MNNFLLGKLKILKQLFDLYLLVSSAFFDRNWYLEKNPDIAKAGVNPYLHYLKHGGFEGRDPSPKFNSSWYLNTYKDVKKTGINPLVHYLRYGKKERRALEFSQKKISTATANRIKRKCDFFFIIGTGRSGTTLMAQVLNAHSKISVPSELQIAFEYSNNGERLAEVFNTNKNLHFCAEDYIQLIKARCPHNLQDYYDYRAFFLAHDYPILSLQSLLTELYTDIAYSQGKSIFAEQTPWYGQNIQLLNRLFPKAKFIHMLRDGRDVAISFARTPWWHKDVNLNLEQWGREVNKIEEDGSLLLKDRMLTVRYEDIVSTPKEVTRKICGFLDVPFEITMLDAKFHTDYGQFSKHSDDAVKPSSAYRNWQKRGDAAFFSGSSYGWKVNKDVNFDNISVSVKEVLRRFGYEV